VSEHHAPILRGILRNTGARLVTHGVLVECFRLIQRNCFVIVCFVVEGVKNTAIRFTRERRLFDAM
jgi:hypothetical protein